MPDAPNQFFLRRLERLLPQRTASKLVLQYANSHRSLSSFHE